MGDFDALEPRMYGIEICLGQTGQIVSPDSEEPVPAFQCSLWQSRAVCYQNLSIRFIAYRQNVGDVIEDEGLAPAELHLVSVVLTGESLDHSVVADLRRWETELLLYRRGDRIGRPDMASLCLPGGGEVALGKDLKGHATVLRRR